MVGQTRPIYLVLDRHPVHLSKLVSAYADTIGIPAVLRPQTVARANELDGDRGFGALLRSAIPAPHTVPNESLALDIDTGDALALARQAGWVDRH